MCVFNGTLEIIPVAGVGSMGHVTVMRVPGGKGLGDVRRVILVEVCKESSIILDILWPRSGWEPGRVQLVGVRFIILLREWVVKNHCVGCIGSSDGDALQCLGLKARTQY